MLNRLAPLALAAVLVSLPAAAQDKKPQAPTTTSAETQKAEREAQLVNVSIELTITDQAGPGEPSKKTVTMVVADRNNSSIRTGGWVQTRNGRRDVMINVDARPTILKNDMVRLDLGLEYQPTGTQDAGNNADIAQTLLHERISTIVESGKSSIISQAADPLSDRRMVVALKATIAR
jgi:hypothetical protein